MDIFDILPDELILYLSSFIKDNALFHLKQCNHRLNNILENELEKRKIFEENNYCRKSLYNIVLAIEENKISFLLDKNVKEEKIQNKQYEYIFYHLSLEDVIKTSIKYSSNRHIFKAFDVCLSFKNISGVAEIILNEVEEIDLTTFNCNHIPTDILCRAHYFSNENFRKLCYNYLKFIPKLQGRRYSIEQYLYFVSEIFFEDINEFSLDKIKILLEILPINIYFNFHKLLRSLLRKYKENKCYLERILFLISMPGFLLIPIDEYNRYLLISILCDNDDLFLFKLFYEFDGILLDFNDRENSLLSKIFVKGSYNILDFFYNLHTRDGDNIIYHNEILIEDYKKLGMSVRNELDDYFDKETFNRAKNMVKVIINSQRKDLHPLSNSNYVLTYPSYKLKYYCDKWDINYIDIINEMRCSDVEVNSNLSLPEGYLEFVLFWYKYVVLNQKPKKKQS